MFGHDSQHTTKILVFKFEETFDVQVHLSETHQTWTCIVSHYPKNQLVPAPPSPTPPPNVHPTALPPKTLILLFSHSFWPFYPNCPLRKLTSSFQSKQPYFGAILDPFWPNLGKKEFSWKKELCQFLNTPIIYHRAKNQKKN